MPPPFRDEPHFFKTQAGSPKLAPQNRGRVDDGDTKSTIRLQPSWQDLFFATGFRSRPLARRFGIARRRNRFHPQRCRALAARTTATNDRPACVDVQLDRQSTDRRTWSLLSGFEDRDARQPNTIDGSTLKPIRVTTRRLIIAGFARILSALSGVLANGFQRSPPMLSEPTTSLRICHGHRDSIPKTIHRPRE